MPLARQMGHVAAAAFATLLCFGMLLHISVVAAYGGGAPTRAVAGVVLGGLFIATVIGMWVLNCPTSRFRRVVGCVLLLAVYMLLFMGMPV